jgi:outer membrane immunogenic protein
MRRHIGWALASVISLGFTGLGAASAADMPLKARPMPVAIDPGYNWTGFYVGASLGGRWSDDDWTTTATGLPLGPPDPFSPTAKFHPSGVRAGGYAGYNWQVSPNWVFGIEGDAAWADNKTTVRGIPGTYGAGGFGGGPLAATLALDSTRVREGADGSLRLRAGYLVSPSWLLYVTGGVAFQEVSMNASCLGSATNASWCIAVRDETASSTRVGWTVGGGAEVMISPNWLLRGEYRYADYGNLSHTFFAGTVDQVVANTRFHTNTATIGIAYKFGGPVVARY